MRRVLKRAAVLAAALLLVGGPATYAHFADRPFVLDCGGLTSDQCDHFWRSAARGMRAHGNGLGPATYARFVVSADGTCVTATTMERGTFTFGLLATYRVNDRVCD